MLSRASYLDKAGLLFVNRQSISEAGALSDMKGTSVSGWNEHLIKAVGLFLSTFSAVNLGTRDK